MPQIINTNIASLNAQRNLNSSQSSLATALTRLSSGLRINSAKDDAAGLAISDRFSTQIRGLNQAIRNANDGISLSQVGEGALAEVSNNLQRIRELAVQSANATNSSSDRAALDLEVQQRLAEIDRIASQTNFNGRKILDGSFGNATFQVGADAGQTIALDLQGSTRLDSVGGIATATSAALGSNATGGTIAVTPVGNNMSTVGTVDGRLEIAATTRSFGEVGQAVVTMDIADLTANAIDGHNTAQAGVGFAADGTTVDMSALDFSTTLGQFDIDDGIIQLGITLTKDYSGDASISTQLVGDINAQLTAAGSLAVASAVDGKLTFKNTGANVLVAVDISNVDAKAGTAGFVADAGVAGNAAGFGASFKVDGHAVTLAADYTAGTTAADDYNLLIADIQADLNAAAPGTYTVTTNGSSSVTITNNLAGSAAVAITERDLGTIESLTVISSDIVSSTTNPAGNDAIFDVDTTTVTLDQNYATYDLMAADIQSQLTGYTVTNDAGTISIVNDAGTPVVAITNANAVATTTGFSNQTGVVGTSGSFSVDGNAVTLTGDYSAGDTTAFNLMASHIGAALGSGYTSAYDATAGTISITNNTLGSAAVVISAADANAIAAGITNSTGTAGTGSGSITLASGDFSIAVGDGTAKDFAGTYASASDLSAAINRELSGIAAEITSDGKLKLMSTSPLTLGGTEAGVPGMFGYTSLSVAANDGSLTTSNVTSVANANETIVRVDAALTSVSNLRSTFGAIQNRFESTISNLTVTAENLTGSRSRIMDADFAMETANLTRAQILQQAGTAMLAQANQIPQNVLSLLR
jgi:flagellin